MVTIIATPGAVDSNSFATRSESDTYHDSILNSGTWVTATDDDKDRALIMSTRILSLDVTWRGVPTTSSQALPFPRRGLLTKISADGGGVLFHTRYINIYGGLLNPLGEELASDTIPQFLKDATSELARSLLTSDRISEQDSGNISSIEIPGLTIGYLGSGSNSKRKLLPPNVYEMIAFYIETMIGYTPRRLIRS